MSEPTFNSPITAALVEQLFKDHLPATTESPGRVIDIGCGDGQILVLAATQRNIIGLGIDKEPSLIDQALNLAKNQNLEDQLTFVAEDVNKAKEQIAANSPYDLAICIGSTHAYGTGQAALTNCLDHFKTILAPQSKAIIGECFWLRPPPQEYLDFLGTTADCYASEQALSQKIINNGYKIESLHRSTPETWDAFENRFLQAARDEHKLANSEESAAKLKRREAWNAMYRKIGRDVLGFGVWVVGL